jgi:hypothetical protein
VSTKSADTKPWETITRSGRSDLTIHPVLRRLFRVACLIEDCGASPELTAASYAAFEAVTEVQDVIVEITAMHKKTSDELVAALYELRHLKGSSGSAESVTTVTK